MLCYRCEHRALSIEAKRDGKHYQPRCECGDHTASKCCCYMFQPCRPVVTTPDGSGRPRFAGALLAARERAQRVLDPQEDGIALGVVWRDGDSVALAWRKAVDKRRSKRV
jgi:hypothetical protein